LGVLLKDRINIYEIEDENNEADMHYKIKVKIMGRYECDKMMVLGDGVLLFASNKFIDIFI